jgi:hypothetical protein
VRGRLRRSRRTFPSGELMLAAMVDMMLNILIFLLTLYGTSPVRIPAGELLLFAPSTARDPVRVSAVLAITTRSISLDGRPILPLSIDDSASGPRIPAGELENGRLPELDAALTDLLVTTRAAAGSGPSEKVQTELIIECDRRIPWAILGPVVRTAGWSGFPNYRFVVRAAGRQEGTPP